MKWIQRLEISLDFCIKEMDLYLSRKNKQKLSISKIKFIYTFSQNSSFGPRLLKKLFIKSYLYIM